MASFFACLFACNRERQKKFAVQPDFVICDRCDKYVPKNRLAFAEFAFKKTNYDYKSEDLIPPKRTFITFAYSKSLIKIPLWQV